MITRVSYPGAGGAYCTGVLTGYTAVQGDVVNVSTARIYALVMDDETRAVVPVDLDRLRVTDITQRSVEYTADGRDKTNRGGR